MAKRIKKPIVVPEKAKEWLRRNEEEGISASQIAKEDYVDVRTVRKHIGLQRSERETLKARHEVLRDCLEKHYADLCSFAEKLRSSVSEQKPEKVSPLLKEDPMWRALHSHLPRIRLWRDLDKWDKMVSEFEVSIENLKTRIRTEAVAKSSMEFSSSLDKTGLYEGFIDGLIFHLHLKALGWHGLEEINYKPLKNTQYGVRVERGAFAIALVTDYKVEDIKSLFDDMMNHALNWEEYELLSEKVQGLLQVKKHIYEELTKIILRRIVPGQCTYCPF